MTNCIQCRSVIKRTLMIKVERALRYKQKRRKESNPGLKGLGLRLVYWARDDGNLDLAYFAPIDGKAPDDFFLHRLERQDVIQSDGTLEKELDDNIPF